MINSVYDVIFGFFLMNFNDNLDTLINIFEKEIIFND